MGEESPAGFRKPELSEVQLESLGFLLNKSALFWRDRIDPALGALGITGPLLAVLKVLWGEGAHTQQELGALGCFDRSSMVLFLDALERLGLVERRRKPGDRRAHVVSLTDKGRRLVPKALEIEAEVQKQYLSCLEAKERRELMKLLRRAVEAHWQEHTKEKGVPCA
jgi:DNA-binding MarR family transcriptional regulator